MLKGTSYSVRRSFTVTAEPVTGRNHCGIGQMTFGIECIVTTKILDEKGFVIDNADYAKLAVNLLPSVPAKRGQKTDIATDVYEFWRYLPDRDKENAKKILDGDDGLLESFNYIKQIFLARNPPEEDRKLMAVSCEEFAGQLVDAIYNKMIDQGWDSDNIESIVVKVGPEGIDANATVTWNLSDSY